MSSLGKSRMSIVSLAVGLGRRCAADGWRLIGDVRSLLTPPGNDIGALANGSES